MSNTHVSVPRYVQFHPQASGGAMQLSADQQSAEQRHQQLLHGAWDASGPLTSTCIERHRNRARATPFCIGFFLVAFSGCPVPIPFHFSHAEPRQPIYFVLFCVGFLNCSKSTSNMPGKLRLEQIQIETQEEFDEHVLAQSQDKLVLVDV